MYHLIRWTVKIIFVFLGLKYEGIHNLPKKGPVIIVANHVSFWDPLMVAAASPRPVNFMAKAELYQNPVLARFFRSLHAFPVKRGNADRAAIRTALDILNSGQVLGIFPEGTRKTGGGEKIAQAGAAMLTIKSGAELIPAACSGAGGKFPWGWGREKLLIRIGESMDVSEYRKQKTNSLVLDKLSAEIMQEINKLLSE